MKCNAEIQTSPLKKQKVENNLEKCSNDRLSSINTTTSSIASIMSSAAAAAAKHLGVSESTLVRLARKGAMRKSHGRYCVSDMQPVA